MKELQVRNRQRAHRVNSRLLREVGAVLLEELLGLEHYELGVHLVSSRAMAELNEQHLAHSGPTDVITFDLREDGRSQDLTGEIYICVEVAQAQSREFHTSWQSEVVRYLTHGVLHLRGYDDLTPAARKVMKREENRLVKRLEKRFDVARLSP